MKDDDLVEILSRQLCEGKKEGWWWWWVRGWGVGRETGLPQPSWHLRVKFHPDSDILPVSSFASFQHNSHLHGSHLLQKKCFVLKEEADC